MANYALITGIDNISIGEEGIVQHHCKLLGHAYSNTVNIHNLLHSNGYISAHIVGTYDSETDLIKEMKSIGNKLKKGDKFLLYYYGVASHNLDNLNIFSGTFSTSAGVNIRLIEEYTAICGVERIILLDLYKQNGFFPSGKTQGIIRWIVEKVANNASSDSPIGFYCNYNDTFPPEEESLFAKTVQSHFSSYSRQGLEISFPAMDEFISETLTKEASNTMPDEGRKAPFFIGNKVVVLHQQELGACDSPTLSNEQKRKKDEVDQQLDIILQDHEEWLSNGRPRDNSGRLTWEKLEPLFAIHEQNRLGPIKLANRKMDYADFTSARFPYGTRFSGSSLCHTYFENSRFDTVDFSNCEMNACNFEGCVATQSDFSNSNLSNSRARASEFICCSFNQASMLKCFFFGAGFDKSFLQEANFINSYLYTCHARKADFTNALMCNCMLNGTNFSDSILTGVNLFGSAHTNWCIDEVECQYVFWDRKGKERFPPDHDFEKGEFCIQHRPYTGFSYTFKDGITPLDLILATHIVDQINAADIGYTIKIDNASIRGLNPTLNFVMESGDEKRNDAKEVFNAEYEHRVVLLEEKLQSAQHLLAERSKRADLAEQQLSEMTSLVPLSSNIPMPENYQQFAEQLFTPLMKELFKDGGLISQYAKGKHKALSDLNHDDLVRYNFIILLGIGQHGNDIPEKELRMMRTGLASFMKDKCLMVFEPELEDTPEDSYIRSTYSVFDNAPKDKPFVAAATTSPGINDRILYTSVYYELRPEEDGDARHSWNKALNRALKKLRGSMLAKSLTDFYLPVLPTKKQSLVCPNGNRIRKLREKIGPMDQVCAVKIQTKSNPENHKLSKTTLIKAGKGEPISLSKLEDIAKLLKVAPKRLIFERIAPNTERLRALREEVICTEEELLEQFGVSTPVFFDLLEEARVVPSYIMRYVHHHYEKLLGLSAGSFADLIDLSKTETLVERPDQPPENPIKAVRMKSKKT